MSDAMPDYRFERMRLERQAKGIRVTVLDQKVQLAEFALERERLTGERKQVEKELPEVLDEGSEVEVLRSQYERERAELAIADIELRLAELEGIESRHRENISASEKALADLDQQTRQMKEAHGG